LGHTRRIHLVLSDHDLLDEIAPPELDEIWSLERARNFATGDEGQAFNTLEISMLDRHNPFLGEEILGVVVN
jgi:hypothetical protein